MKGSAEPATNASDLAALITPRAFPLQFGCSFRCNSSATSPAIPLPAGAAEMGGKLLKI
jgi:hypothetical protein